MRILWEVFYFLEAAFTVLTGREEDKSVRQFSKAFLDANKGKEMSLLYGEVEEDRKEEK